VATAQARVGRVPSIAHAPPGAGVQPVWRQGRLMCEHLHDTTTRYDQLRHILTFVLVCPECRTERVVETLEYSPRYVRTV
jgi:hypothetical protein